MSELAYRTGDVSPDEREVDTADDNAAEVIIDDSDAVGDVADAESDEAAEEESIEEEEKIDEPNADSSPQDIDYEALIEEDLKELRATFPELRGLGSITELKKPMRYAALRDLGLSPKEAYLATTEPHSRDNRSHLDSAVPRAAGGGRSSMTRGELERARDLFPGLKDSELIGLYKKVNL